MPFLDDYEPVEARIDKFYGDHKEGRIITELVSFDGAQWVFKSSVYRAPGEPAAATGHAHEVTSQRGVNATSACENCETSAIGRALANLNYAAKGRRPSREEMGKATRSRAAAGSGNAPRELVPAGPGNTRSSGPVNAEDVSGEGAPAVAPNKSEYFVAGQATIDLLQSRIAALVADKVAVSDHRKARNLPPCKPGISDAHAEGWKTLLDELEAGLEAPFASTP